MEKKQSSSEETSQAKDPENFLRNAKVKKNNSTSKTISDSDNRDVLIKVGGFEYKTPTKQTRVFLGSLVLGLNLILVLAVVAYFYIPAFHDFIYNVGRN